MSLDAPVLTQTSAIGANPLQWQGAYNNSIIYDGAGNGDMVRMRFNLNGGALTTEVDQPLDAATLLSGTYSWPLYNATTFSAGGLVAVQEQKARFTAYASCVTTNASAVVTMPSTTGIVAGKAITGAGIPARATVLSIDSGTQITMSANATASATATLGFETLTSAWTTLSDTIAAAAFALSDLYGAGDIGNAWNPTDLSHVWTSLAGTGAGAFASPVGRLDDISGKGNHWNASVDDGTRPTLANTNNGLLTYAGGQRMISAASGFYAAGAMTLIVAVKAATNANFIWAATNSAGSTQVYAPGTRGRGVGADVLNFQRNNANAAIANPIAAGLLDNAIHILVVTDDGTHVKTSVDGGAFVTDTYVRNAPLTVDRTCLGDAFLNSITDFGLFTGGIGAGLAIGRILTGALGTAGTEMTKAYNKIAAYHGLTQL